MNLKQLFKYEKCYHCQTKFVCFSPTLYENVYVGVCRKNHLTKITRSDKHEVFWLAFSKHNTFGRDIAFETYKELWMIDFVKEIIKDQKICPSCSHKCSLIHGTGEYVGHVMTLCIRGHLHWICYDLIVLRMGDKWVRVDKDKIIRKFLNV